MANTAVVLSFYSKFDRISAPELGQHTTIDKNPKDTSRSEGDLHGEVSLSPTRLGPNVNEGIY